MSAGLRSKMAPERVHGVAEVTDMAQGHGREATDMRRRERFLDAASIALLLAVLVGWLLLALYLMRVGT